MLHILGLSPVEQGLYEALVARPPVTHTELLEIAAEHGWAGEEGPVLARLSELGLLSRVDSTPPRYAAVAPRRALDLPLAARRWELARARRHLTALSARHGASAADDARVTVLRGSEAIDRRFNEIKRGTRGQILGFDTAPYNTDPLGDPSDDLNALRRGVAFRILHDRTALDVPGRLAIISETVAAGEHARVGTVPIKMMLFDGRVGFLACGPDVHPGEAALLVRDRTLLAALALFFEVYWDRGVPLRIRDGRAEIGGPPELSATERELLSLLVSGFTDRAIATNLGWADRTVRRWVRRLTERLGADTRFQAGYQAVRQGWVTPNDSPDAAER